MGGLGKADGRLLVWPRPLARLLVWPRRLERLLVHAHALLLVLELVDLLLLLLHNLLPRLHVKPGLLSRTGLFLLTLLC